MKYKQDIIINKPVNEVVEKFRDPDNIKHWQRGFIFLKHLNGEFGAEGSQNLLKYEISKREIEMKETILKNNLPSEYEASYVADGVYNHQLNKFEEVNENSTIWISYSEFKFSGFMKLIGKLMPGTFKKQSKQFMDDFKIFVEEGKSVLDE